jgi:hypothetical protein
MRNVIAIAAAAFAALAAVSHAQRGAAGPQTAPSAQEPPAVAVRPVHDLSDLQKLTFDCPKAALNAAAREALKVPSQGTYQFSYFTIASDSHHAAYEVHFKSNYEGEKELKYCVAIYCQQGWDPATTKASVTLMGSERRPAGGAAHGAECSVKAAPVKARVGA